VGTEEFPVPGVRGLEHTADVGLEIEAPDLPELFGRAALGAMWLVLERSLGVDLATPGPVDAPEDPRTVELVEVDLPALLRSWLRTLLFWEETEGFVATGVSVKIVPAPLCASEDGSAFGLQARVAGKVDRGPRVREIKGVTFHDLQVERMEEGWQGRVIFDV
jgi:SHS2 domain-containing protein